MPCHRPVGRLVSGRTISRKDPVASGGDGVLSFPPRGGGYHRPVRASTWLAAIVAAGLLAAACTSTPSPNPSGTAAPGATDLPSAPVATVNGSPGPSLPSQTDTAWGRIWDALPSTFPALPGSLAATDTGAGATSGQILVPASRDEVVQFFRQSFRDAGATIGTEGPLEDGSVTVTADDGAGCRIQLSVRGTGTREAMVSVLYGAGCPFE